MPPFVAVPPHSCSRGSAHRFSLWPSDYTKSAPAKSTGTACLNTNSTSPRQAIYIRST